MGGSEGCFMVNLAKSKSHSNASKTSLEEPCSEETSSPELVLFKTCFWIKPVILLTQHERDEQLMRWLIKYFYSGNLNKDREVIILKVSKFKHIAEKIISFFKKHPIHGVKAKYLDPPTPYYFF